MTWEDLQFKLADQLKIVSNEKFMIMPVPYRRFIFYKNGMVRMESTGGKRLLMLATDRTPYQMYMIARGLK